MSYLVCSVWIYEPISWSRWWQWQWQWLWESSQNPEAAFVAIAVLMAFLTVVAVWKIPKPRTELVREPVSADASNVGAFDNNFSRTVLGGLGGLAGVAILEDIWTTAEATNPKLTYLFWFVISFFLFLFLTALLQASVEALRSRLLQSRVIADKPKLNESDWIGKKFWSWCKYGILRWWRWLLSFRSAVVIFLETFFNVLQGNTKTKNAVLGETILSLQSSLVATVNELAASIEESIEEWVSKEAESTNGERVSVRVNISVMADDRQSLYYISRQRGSSGKIFGRRSIAWIAAVIGEARWVKESYKEEGDVILYDNTKRHPDFVGEPEKIYLNSYYQPRAGQDYEAFMVLPVPWSKRRERGGREAVIHISFDDAKHMDLVWKGLDKSTDEPRYKKWEGLLQECPDGDLCIQDGELCRLLMAAVRLLPEAVREINPAALELEIKPR